MADFTLTGFAAHLVALVAEMEHVEHRALDLAAAVVQKQAKTNIGHYQEDGGPFVGWAELADSTKSDRVRLGYPENEPELRDGTLRDSYEREVSGREAHIGSDSQVAEWQELGTSKMPPRSIVGLAAFQKAAEVKDILGDEVVAHLEGRQVVGGRLMIE